MKKGFYDDKVPTVIISSDNYDNNNNVIIERSERLIKAVL